MLKWLCSEQAISGKELAELSGIAPQTWSKVRQGKQDLSSGLLWRCMKAIALLQPRSDVARVVDIIEGNSRPVVSLNQLIEVSEDKELGEILVVVSDELARRLKTKTRENTVARKLVEVKA